MTRCGQRSNRPRRVPDCLCGQFRVPLEVVAQLLNRLVLLIADALRGDRERLRDIADRVAVANHVQNALLPRAEHPAGRELQRLALLAPLAIAAVARVGDRLAQTADTGAVALVPLLDRIDGPQELAPFVAVASQHLLP